MLTTLVYGGHMKKLISIFLLFSLILVSFTSCMSEDEKQRVRENEKIAIPMIERYVEENYKGAVIESVKCLTVTNDTLFVTTKATDYTKAEVSYQDETFNVVFDSKTGKIYNNYNQHKIVDKMETLVFDEIPVDIPKDTEIRFMPSDFADFVDGGWGYLEKDIDSVEDLLKTDRYKIFVLCKYVNSQMNFESIPIKSFLKDEYKSDIQIAFVNYRDGLRYENKEVLDHNYIGSLFSLYDNDNGFYKISDLKLASQVNDNEEQSDGESTTELVYEEEYKHYKSEVYDNIEFVWDDEFYDIDFSETNAEPVVEMENYSEALFYAINEKEIKLNCTKITDKEIDPYNKVYMYFPRDVYGEYIFIKNNGVTDVELLDLTRIDYVFKYQVLCDNNHEFSVSCYRKENTDQKQ